MMGRRKPNFTLRDIEGAGGASGAGLGAGRPSQLRNDTAPAFSNFSKIVYVAVVQPLSPHHRTEICPAPSILAAKPSYMQMVSTFPMAHLSK
jgi:hypothetical protein